MPLAAPIRDYLMNAILTTPPLLSHLLPMPGLDPRWDLRNDPERFTLREVAAHLADWDEVWLGRIELMVAEDRPLLPGVDEGKMCEENDYAHSVPAQQLERLSQSRQRIADRLRSLPLEAWDRTAMRENYGELDLRLLVSLMLGHDAYHVRQVLGHL